MSADQDQVRQIAERIAQRLSSSGDEPPLRAVREDSRAHGHDGDDLNALRATLAEMQRRLAHIESHITHDETCQTNQPTTQPLNQPTTQPHRFVDMHDNTRSLQSEAKQNNATAIRSPWLSGTYVPATSHPSGERFGISEAVSEMVDYFENEKTCNVEPGGKPCDHCSMCSSRGF